MRKIYAGKEVDVSFRSRGVYPRREMCPRSARGIRYQAQAVDRARRRCG